MTPERLIDAGMGLLVTALALGVLLWGLNTPPVEADSLADPALIEFVKNGG